ncbi:MAG: hypothetical protein B7X99_09170 [Rhizobiales bacterium 17-65-6]|nr:MAG: hypothetical protein B7X99_09170 [Rhizobiales bacterium 17-65-6]
MSPFGSAGLEGLRRRIAAIEAGGAGRPAEGVGLRWMPLGLPALDQALGGGLAWESLHEVAGQAAGLEGTVTAFGLALAVRAARMRRRPVLVVQQDLAGLEGGRLYGPGLAEAGLPEGAVILVQVRRAEEALLVMEEGLKCTGLSVVMGEIASRLPDALTATRRLSLAAQAGGGLGLLLRPKPDPAPCAAQTRWRVAPAPGRPDAWGGLGQAGLAADLVRNRSGPPGRWQFVLRDGCLAQETEADRTEGWPAHDRTAHDRTGHDHPAAPLHAPAGGAALSQPVAGAAVHGPPRTRRAR